MQIAESIKPHVNEMLASIIYLAQGSKYRNRISFYVLDSCEKHRDHDLSMTEVAFLARSENTQDLERRFRFVCALCDMVMMELGQDLPRPHMEEDREVVMDIGRTKDVQERFRSFLEIFGHGINEDKEPLWELSLYYALAYNEMKKRFN